MALITLCLQYFLFCDLGSLLQPWARSKAGEPVPPSSKLLLALGLGWLLMTTSDLKAQEPTPGLNIQETRMCLTIPTQLERNATHTPWRPDLGLNASEGRLGKKE